MKTFKVIVTTEYEIEIYENNYIVKEYGTDGDLINDLAAYGFSDVLPVISEEGVKVIDSTIGEVEFYQV